MPVFNLISRADLIRALRKVGFTGPEPGGKHPAMRKGTFTLTIPNVHRGDIGRNLLARILKQANITREEWEQL